MGHAHTAFPPEQLAAWCREDGHETCAILIEESPEVLLPSVLWWVAKHIEANLVYDDEEARILPTILRDESAALRARRGVSTLTDRRAGIALVGIFLLTFLLDGLWPSP